MLNELTAAEFKRRNCNRRAVLRATMQEQVRQELNKLQDAGGDDAVGAGRAKRAMQDDWTKRHGTDVRGLYNERAARTVAPLSIYKLG